MTDTSLGRIKVLSVPLPHNGTSLNARLSRTEKILADSAKPFKDDSGENTVKDHDVDFPSDTYPSVVADDPVVIAYEPQQPKSASELELHGFSKRLKATQDSAA